MTKTGLEFAILVIVICPSTLLRVVSLSNHLIFGICDLEFLFLSLHPANTCVDYPTAISANYQTEYLLTARNSR